MAFEFKTAADGLFIDVGGASPGNNLLFQTSDVSLGLWLRCVPLLAVTGDVLLHKANAFFSLECIRAEIVVDPTYGIGVAFGHERVGFVNVVCLPGQIDPKYKVTTTGGAWVYFGVSRLGTNYFSYFGNRLALVDAQFAAFSTGPALIDNGGLFAVGGGTGGGNQTHGEQIGPWSYWKRALTKAEHLQLAQCTQPADPTNDMLIWVKMFNPPSDVSTYAWTVNTHPSLTLPKYVGDPGCQILSSADNYTARVS
jgi:hypothetical protein